MAKRIVQVVLIAGALSGCGSPEESKKAPSLEEYTTRAAAEIEQTMSENRIPGAVFSVVIDGKLAVTHPLGAREQGRPEPVTAESRFAVGSLTKSITAAAILTAVSEGKLTLEQPVDELVSFTLNDAADPGAITLHHLLSHQSGIVDWNPMTFPPPYPKCRTLEDYFEADELVQAVSPGKVWMYTSAGYALAGRVLEVADGRTYVESVHARVLEPAGMTNATFDVGEFLAGDHVSLHVPAADGTPVPSSLAACPTLLPTAHLLATAEDIAHWGEVMLQDGAPVLSSASFAQMVEPHVSDGLTNEYYGYGMWVGPYQVDEWFHSGRWAGNRSCLVVVPSRNFAAVLLLNSDALVACDPLQKIVEIYLDLADVPPPVYQPDPSGWDDLVGTYNDAIGFGAMAVRRDGENLIANFSDVPGHAPVDHVLESFDRNIFSLEQGTTSRSLVFWRDDAGQGEYAVLGLAPSLTVFARAPTNAPN